MTSLGSKQVDCQSAHKEDSLECNPSLCCMQTRWNHETSTTSNSLPWAIDVKASRTNEFKQMRIGEPKGRTHMAAKNETTGVPRAACCTRRLIHPHHEGGITHGTLGYLNYAALSSKAHPCRNSCETKQASLPRSNSHKLFQKFSLASL